MSWKFWEKSGSMELSPRMKTFLAEELECNAAQSTKLRYMEQSGKYSGRSVKYVRVFDPALTVGTLSYDEIAPSAIFDGRLEDDGTPFLKLPRKDGVAT